MGDQQQAEVRAAFGRWAARHTGAPRNPETLIQDVVRSDAYAGLMTTEVQGRRAVWKAVPAAGKARISVPAVTLETVDPWNVLDRLVLRERSDHIALCADCSGEGKLLCSTCHGGGKLLCGTCGGQRKMYGYASNGSRRLLNCTNCRGKGQVDCTECRRGIASCRACDGEGRMQRWIELEQWHRLASNTYPHGFARQFGWDDNAANDVIARDADLVIDIIRPHRLTAADIGSVPPQWLDNLAEALAPGERIAQQRLRMARIPTYSVRYTIGSDQDAATFAGHRLLPEPTRTASAFARRARRLHMLGALLLLIAAIFTVFSLARGLFYWSTATLLSIVAFAAGMAAVYGGAVQRTSGQRPARGWAITTAAGIVLAFALAFAALPRLKDAEGLITAGKLEDAERELRALGDDAGPWFWAELRLARIRAASNIEQARKELAQIPATLPQHGAGARAFDTLILREVQKDADAGHWGKAAAVLALLSDAAHGQPATVAAASAVYIPITRDDIEGTDWAGAADAIVAARRLGVRSEDLTPLIATMRTAAEDAVAKAKQEPDPATRLRERMAAEEMLVSSDRAADNWGTPPLIALRTSMARDVAALEKAARKRR